MIRRIPPTHSAPDHSPYDYDDPRRHGAQVEEGWGSTPRVPDKEYLIKRDAKFDAQTLLSLIGLAEGSRAPVGGDWDDGSRLPVPEPWSLIPGRRQRGSNDEGYRDLAADSIGVMLRKRLYDGKVTVSSVDVLGPAFNHVAAGDCIISVNATPADKVTLERIVSIMNGPQGLTVMSHCVVEVGDLQGGGLRSLVFARRPLPLPTPASYPGQYLLLLDVYICIYVYIKTTDCQFLQQFDVSLKGRRIDPTLPKPHTLVRKPPAPQTL